MLKITLDTNILVSGSFWTGDSFKILELADNSSILLILSADILNEYYDVLQREEILKKTRKKNLTISKTVFAVINSSIIVESQTKIDIIKEDPDDNKIIECAKEGNADYIITKDEHLLKLKDFEGIKIVKPDEFLGIFEEHKG
ncbi:MAG: putative toxin-antitoxin system toxin component, PIN family [Candidatus Nanoarchaeia archaeon]